MIKRVFTSRQRRRYHLHSRIKSYKGFWVNPLGKQLRKNALRAPDEQLKHARQPGEEYGYAIQLHL